MFHIRNISMVFSNESTMKFEKKIKMTEGSFLVIVNDKKSKKHISLFFLIIHTLFLISMALCKTAVTPLLTSRSYWTHGQRHRYCFIELCVHIQTS